MVHNDASAARARPTASAHVPPAPCWQRRLESDDIDAHAGAQPGSALRYEQISGGRFAGLLHQVQLPHARLVHEQCNVAVRQRGVLGRGQFGFAMPLGAGAAPAIFNGQKVHADDVMLGSAAELDLCTPAGFGLIGVVIDGELLHPLWQQMYGRSPSDWIESQLVVATRPGLAEGLRACHLRALADASLLVEALGRTGGAMSPTPAGAIAAQSADLMGPRSADDTALRQCRDDLLIEWFEALPDSIDASALPGVRARKRLVDRACELMLALPDEPLSMLEVCRRLGSSRRKLNYCFQEVLGSSPVKYLRAVRLNGARRELLAGSGAVQDVAARWGFWHAGQFSRDYKRQFAETPSATLGRR